MPNAHALSSSAVFAILLGTLAACSVEPEPRPPGASNEQTKPQQATAELTADSAVAAAPPTAPLAKAAGSGSRRIAPASAMQAYRPRVGGDRYPALTANAIQRVIETPISTFSADVDTAAYANIRRYLLAGQRPPRDAVRVEEMLNYFDYDYPAKVDRTQPFRVHSEIAPSPWAEHTHLLQIGIQADDLDLNDRPPVNLVFLIDVSGSMQGADRLPLLKQSLRLLIDRLRRQDRLALVVYAGASGLALESTPGDQKQRLLSALDRLSAGGSTNGGEGIRLAYATARQHADGRRVSRVILATDGDFNVGTVDQARLLDLIAREARDDIGLSVLGFGRGNYNDALMEALSNRGNGNAAYIDSLKEANKVLVREIGGTLYTVAKDLKIQIEFNPEQVAEYRLIGYENRHLQREDFNNDRVDAGDVGAGHSVTAMYEIRLRGQPGSHFEPLRYGPSEPLNSDHQDELAFVRLRYKLPDQDRSRLFEQAVQHAQIGAEFETASSDFRFAAAVAGFGQWLRGGRYLQSFDTGQVLTIARAARGNDPDGERAEFVQLVDLSRNLQLARQARP